MSLFNLFRPKRFDPNSIVPIYIRKKALAQRSQYVLVGSLWGRLHAFLFGKILVRVDTKGFKNIEIALLEWIRSKAQLDGSLGKPEPSTTSLGDTEIQLVDGFNNQTVQERNLVKTRNENHSHGLKPFISNELASIEDRFSKSSNNEHYLDILKQEVARIADMQIQEIRPLAVREFLARQKCNQFKAVNNIDRDCVFSRSIWWSFALVGGALLFESALNLSFFNTEGSLNALFLSGTVSFVNILMGGIMGWSFRYKNAVRVHKIMDENRQVLNPVRGFQRIGGYLGSFAVLYFILGWNIALAAYRSLVRSAQNEAESMISISSDQADNLKDKAAELSDQFGTILLHSLQMGSDIFEQVKDMGGVGLICLGFISVFIAAHKAYWFADPIPGYKRYAKAASDLKFDIDQLNKKSEQKVRDMIEQFKLKIAHNRNAMQDDLNFLIEAKKRLLEIRGHLDSRFGMVRSSLEFCVKQYRLINSRNRQGVNPPAYFKDNSYINELQIEPEQISEKIIPGVEEIDIWIGKITQEKDRIQEDYKSRSDQVNKTELTYKQRILKFERSLGEEIRKGGFVLSNLVGDDFPNTTDGLDSPVSEGAGES